MNGKFSSLHSEQTLCCCEYINEKNERSHIVGCCCDCEDLDESCDRFLCCRPLPSGASSRMTRTLLDRLRVPYCDGRGARAIDIHSFLGALLMPVSLLLASGGFLWMLFTATILPFLLFVTYRYYQTKKLQKNFFYAWNLSSLVLVLIVFQIKLLPQLEIDFLEHVFFMVLVSASCLLIKETRLKQNRPIYRLPYDEMMVLPRTEQSYIYSSQSQQSLRSSQSYSQSKTQVSRESQLQYYCIWFNCFVDEGNRRFFLLGLLSIILACLYGADLIFTTLCVPDLLWDISTILIPFDCRTLFSPVDNGDFINIVIGFYLLSVAAVTVLLLLVHQLQFLKIKTWLFFVK